MEPITHSAQDQLFFDARTHSYWQDKPVPQPLLKELHDLVRMAPTSANCCPMRVVFIVSKEGKARLKPALNEGNVEKTLSAPVTAIIAHDMRFYEHLPKLFPHAPAREWFADNPELAETTAFRNGSIQGAILFWRRGPWGWTVVLCRGLITHSWITNSLAINPRLRLLYRSIALKATLNPTSSVISDMAWMPNCTRAILALNSMKYVGSFNHAEKIPLGFLLVLIKVGRINGSKTVAEFISP